MLNSYSSVISVSILLFFLLRSHNNNMLAPPSSFWSLLLILSCVLGGTAQTLDLTGYKVTFFDDFDTFDLYNATSKTGT